MKILNKMISMPFRFINRTKIKLEKHIDYCNYMLEICNRKSNNLKSYYFRKQIETTKIKLINNQIKKQK
jgi:hypothetical protein